MNLCHNKCLEQPNLLNYSGKFIHHLPVESVFVEHLTASADHRALGDNLKFPGSFCFLELTYHRFGQFLFLEVYFATRKQNSFASSAIGL
ncbi:hypothetical protein Leryth_027127 [Lithospermum erythrorhizon]|nr:hypothetical protein Leryth_027127 [Lithospermum erythrorhizon]